MPHNCEHAHGSPAAKADWLTNTTAGVQAITSFISMLFFTARFIDSAANFEASIADISYPGLSIGIAFAMFGTIGSTYAHRTLNALHQATHSEPQHSEVRIESEAQSLLNAAATETPKNAGLTKLQLMALAGDILQHTAETAAPLAFIVALAIHLSRWEKVAANIVCLFIGAAGSAASVRTCYRAISKTNANDSQGEHDHGHSHGDESGSERSLCSHHSHS